MQDKSALLEESLILVAPRTLNAREPFEFLDYILTHLPAPLRHLAQHRQKILNRLESAPVQQNDRELHSRCVYNNEEDR